ncbi:MAG: hypothetical protein V4632_08990 [Pseudomonadota bacterium]
MPDAKTATGPALVVPQTAIVVRHAPIHGFCRLLEGDCGVADARQGTALAVLGALHSPPINAADRFATRKLKRDEPRTGESREKVLQNFVIYF